jgi:hypothetical protein
LAVFAPGLVAVNDDQVQRHIKSLKDAKPANRAKAAEALGKLGKAAKPALPALCLAVADPDDNVREAALGALEEISPKLARLVVELAMEKDSAKQATIGIALRRLEADGAPAAGLVREHVRLAFKSINAKMIQKPLPFKQGPIDPGWFYGHFEVLVHYLRDEETIQLLEEATKVDRTKYFDAKTQQDLPLLAVGALGDLGKNDKKSRKSITKVLVEFLGTLDPKKEVGVPRSYVIAINVLQSFGPDAKDALPALKKLKRHPAEEIRRAAGNASDAIGG